MTTRIPWVSFTLSAVMIGCSGTGDPVPPFNGGSSSTDMGGNSTTQGGSAARTGGSSSEGGKTSQTTTSTSAAATGGLNGTGGASTTNMPATGGKSNTGGKGSAGGTRASGGSNATGGNSMPGTGGSKTTGGSEATGGAKSSGGSSAGVGGTRTTGGAQGTGGSNSSGGGSASTGGKANTGGTSPAGGAASFKCDNLSLAPSTSGKPKPAGAAGGLKVLDWAGFTGAVSFTFDDNTPSQMANYSALKATGAHFTWFVVGSWNPSSQYKSTLADGQEIANHTYSHQSAGSQSDLQQNETYISTNFGVTANSMAAPNCDQSWSSVAPNVLFQNRGPCGSTAATVSPRDSTNPFLLPAYLPATGASSATMDATLSAGKWRIFVIHGFDSQGGTYQPVPIGNVTTSMSNAVKNGYWAETMTNVGAYWQGQKLISASATTSATWTLPAHFPANMCVRITTTGGTVTQKGQEVPWDDHGYYQISLDAGSVTIQ